jgi:hypothetical protein
VVLGPVLRAIGTGACSGFCFRLRAHPLRRTGRSIRPARCSLSARSASATPELQTRPARGATPRRGACPARSRLFRSSAAVVPAHGPRCEVSSLYFLLFTMENTSLRVRMPSYNRKNFRPTHSAYSTRKRPTLASAGRNFASLALSPLRRSAVAHKIETIPSLLSPIASATWHSARFHLIKPLPSSGGGAAIVAGVGSTGRRCERYFGLSRRFARAWRPIIGTAP